MSFGPYRPDDDGAGTSPDRAAWSRQRAIDRHRAALETPADRLRLLRRVRGLEWAMVVLVVALLLGFWQLQVVQGARYTELANQNLTQHTRIRSARGLILDRRGKVLATNRPAYEVALVREASPDVDGALRWLSGLLEIPHEVLEDRLAQQRDLPRFRPAVLASGVAQAQVVSIEARRREYPGVIVQVTARRYYPNGTSAAHVLGHVGEISRRQLEGWGERFLMGDVVGQQGVERVYNDDLVGAAGSKLAVVNSVGREVRVIEQNPPAPGETVVLTIDEELQRRIEEILGERRGAVVALDVETGGILAMVSAPAFDPNAFASRFSTEQWEEIVSDPARPLSNRALQAALPPGSLFKLVMATAGLEEGIIGPSTTYFCPGGKTLYGRFFRCQGQHGNISVVDALALSCNTFFYELGVRLGRERIIEWAEKLGLGAVTGVDLPDEQEGILPTDEWLQRAGLRFYAGDTVSIAIGQGRLAVSPLQVAQMAAIIGSGFVREPHLLARVEESSGLLFGSRRYAARARTADFTEATRELVLRGMEGSVAYGTSRRAGLPNVAVGGKTGTAQVVSADRVARNDEDRREELRNHAWFVALAPVEAPRIALAVFIEHGGSGGAVAAPVGAQVLSTYFGLPAEQVEFREIPVAPAQEPADRREAPARPGRQP